MTTCAPRLESIVVIACPSPVPPPVMKAVFPLKHPSGSIGVRVAGKYLDCSPTHFVADFENNRLPCKINRTLINYFY